MSSKTKIVVLRMKEIIYTAIFIGLGLLLITLALIMFRPKKDAVQTSSAQIHYIPGVYTANLMLGSQAVNVEVAVDSGHINSVCCVPLSDSVATMYPLMASAADQLSEQIVNTQSLDNLSYSEGSRYTSEALVNAVRTALHKAQAAEK